MENVSSMFPYGDLDAGETVEDRLTGPGASIRSLKRKTELLAPAGKWEALEAVLEAGADAVYLSGKRFQMRAHRKDFNFDDEALARAVTYAHERNKRVYVTVNALLAEHELEDCRSFLVLLQEAGADGAIVCDLAVLALARELGVTYELHGSTMMNIHEAGQARVLKRLGLHRAVTSRDIGIAAAGRLGDESGLAVEYFLHGDMCVAQSGACSLSGIVFGKSSNRGECMKPCRWKYDLLRADIDAEPIASGHLMAIRDLSLCRQIPELVDAGIGALKIEGRMRDAGYLRDIVGIYRGLLDKFYACPQAYRVTPEEAEALFKLRVREQSSLTATGAPSNTTFFDISGIREPLMISNGLREDEMPSCLQEAEWTSPVPAAAGVPALAVTVASPQGAAAALEAGASRIYLAAETSQYGAQQWTADRMQEAVDLVRAASVELGFHTPHVSSAREEAAWVVMESLCPGPDYVLAHHFGTLAGARKHFPGAAIVADTGFNVLNTRAAEALLEWGVSCVAPSLEAGLEDVAVLAAHPGLELELFAHGPVTGMLLDHCIIAMNLTRGGSRDVCRSICGRTAFSLRDQKGETRSIMTDQYCRNHIMTARDVALLPHLPVFLRMHPASLRIDGTLYSPQLLGRIVRAYRDFLDRYEEDGDVPGPAPELWEPLCADSPRPWNLGGYAQSVTRSASTLETKKRIL